MKEIEVKMPIIEVAGGPGTGKSCIAYAIKNALKEYDIDCLITGCEDENPILLESSWKDRIKSLKGKSFVVRTKQIKRENCYR